MKYFQFAFSFRNSRIFKLKQQQQCINQASQSAVLSIASFIIWKFPHLPPPNDIHLHNVQIPICQHYPSEQQHLHPYFQLWIDSINNCILEGRAVVHQETLFIQIPLRGKYQAPIFPIFLGEFEEEQIVFNKQTKRERVQAIFKLPPIKPNNKKIAIFMNSVTINKNNPLSPRLNAPALFLGSLFNNEEWHNFNIVDGQIPTIEELISFDCVILTGSSHSVLHPPPQISQAIHNLFEAYKINEKLKIIGICFGHQLIANYFFAKIQRKEMKVGLQKIVLDQQQIQKYPFLEPLTRLKQGFLSEIHEDYVETVPAGFKLLGRSNSCKVQLLVSQNSRIFTTQFHSQYLCHYIKAYDHRLRHYNHYNPIKNYYIPSDPQTEQQNLRDSLLVRECFQNLIYL